MRGVVGFSILALPKRDATTHNAVTPQRKPRANAANRLSVQWPHDCVVSSQSVGLSLENVGERSRVEVSRLRRWHRRAHCEKHRPDAGRALLLLSMIKTIIGIFQLISRRLIRFTCPARRLTATMWCGRSARRAPFPGRVFVARFSRVDLVTALPTGD